MVERGIEEGGMDRGRETRGTRGSEGCIDGRIYFELTWNRNKLEGGVESSSFFFLFFYYHIAYVKKYSSLHTVQILTILMTQIFSITYRAPKDITYNTAIYIPYGNTYLNKRISIK